MCVCVYTVSLFILFMHTILVNVFVFQVFTLIPPEWDGRGLEHCAMTRVNILLQTDRVCVCVCMRVCVHKPLLELLTPCLNPINNVSIPYTYRYHVCHFFLRNFFEKTCFPEVTQRRSSLSTMSAGHTGYQEVTERSSVSLTSQRSGDLST